MIQCYSQASKKKKNFLEKTESSREQKNVTKQNQGVFLQTEESESEAAQSCPTLRPMDCGYQASPSMEISRQEYWSALPFPKKRCCNRKSNTGYYNKGTEKQRELLEMKYIIIKNLSQ